MKTLALTQGDLTPAPGGYRMLEGANKIQQDIGLALQEEYGTDSSHPLWGSILPTMIGAPITEDLKQQIRVEVNRVVNNYIAVQNARIVQDNVTGSQSSMTTDDVVNAITGLSITQLFDSVVINLGLQTISRQNVNLNHVVTTS